MLSPTGTRKRLENYSHFQWFLVYKQCWISFLCLYVYHTHRFFLIIKDLTAMHFGYYSIPLVVLTLIWVGNSIMYSRHGTDAESADESLLNMLCFKNGEFGARSSPPCKVPGKKSWDFLAIRSWVCEISKRSWIVCR